MILCHPTSRTPNPDLSFSDAGGVSSLGWLLDQYLEHREKARSRQGQAASFASQVRRLCHLLVHVEAPPGPSPEPSSQPRESSAALKLSFLCFSRPLKLGSFPGPTKGPECTHSLSLFPQSARAVRVRTEARPRPPSAPAPPLGTSPSAGWRWCRDR